MISTGRSAIECSHPRPIDVSSVLYNEPLLRGHAASSSLHQVRGGKEREEGGGEVRGKGAAQCGADRGRSASRNDL